MYSCLYRTHSELLLLSLLHFCSSSSVSVVVFREQLFFILLVVDSNNFNNKGPVLQYYLDRIGFYTTQYNTARTVPRAGYIQVSFSTSLANNIVCTY